MVNRIWDEQSVSVLTEKYATTTVTELTKMLPFTDAQIRKKAKLLGLKKSEEGYEFNKWTKDDEKLIVDNYESKSVNELVKMLNNKFTNQQIRNKIYRMGLTKANKWTKELEEYLLNNYQNKSIPKMKNEKLHSFTENAIYKKLNKLGVTLSNNVSWSKNEEEIMTKFYHLRTNREMQELLPRFTREQIKSKAKNMGLKKLPLVIYKANVNNGSTDAWTDEERIILIDHYGKIPNKKIKEEYLPHRSLNAIKKQAQKLCLIDKLRYQFQWEYDDFIFNEEEPNSMTIVIKKRRMDVC